MDVRINQPLLWRTSSYSTSNGECVEVAAMPSIAVVARDSKLTNSPIVRFTGAPWRNFTDTLK